MVVMSDSETYAIDDVPFADTETGMPYFFLRQYGTARCFQTYINHKAALGVRLVPVQK